MRGTERLRDISPPTFVLQPPKLGEEPTLASPWTQVIGRECERKTEVLGTGGFVRLLLPPPVLGCG